MITPWLMTPLVAMTIIAGCAAIARLERAKKSNVVITLAALGMLIIVIGLLLLNSSELVLWMMGVLVGVGVGYSLFFHRNAGRPPNGSPAD